ncbi:uroporphyrinogen-III synthase [Cupriavidus basilensis]
MADFALVVFVSPNAIQYALDALAAVQGNAVAQWPPGVPVAVVGPASVAALAERGIAAPDHRVIAPAGADGNGTDGGANGEDARFDSEALWAQLEPAALNGRAVLIVRGNGGRDWLGDRLREAGAEVTAVEAYQRTVPEPGAMQWQAVRDGLSPGGAPQAWLLTSSEAVRNLDTLARWQGPVAAGSGHPETGAVHRAACGNRRTGTRALWLHAHPARGAGRCRAARGVQTVGGRLMPEPVPASAASTASAARFRGIAGATARRPPPEPPPAMAQRGRTRRQETTSSSANHSSCGHGFGRIRIVIRRAAPRRRRLGAGGRAGAGDRWRLLVAGSSGSTT